MKIATSDEIRAIAGVDTRKCMKCGKCSASCPAYNEMDIRPHQFVSYVQNGDVEALMNSKVHLEMPLLLRMCRALSKRRKTCQTDRGSSSFRDPSERRELSFSG